MVLFRKAKDIHDLLLEKRAQGISSGFVPTMGALHQGHLSLINAGKAQNGFTVCSIFVNPLQFNNSKDLEKYPITTENDIYLLEKAGCDALFLPSVDEMYPASSSSTEQYYDLGHLETILEGKYRPGHFQGVCRVMDRLLNIIPADNLYLGQKDLQQCMVIKRLIELLNMPTRTIICATEREANGLAMSSRNMRLSDAEKQTALAIYRSLLAIKDGLGKESLADLKENAGNYLTTEGFKTDYIEICNANDLTEVKAWDGKTPLVALCAAFLNEVRLIDNMLLN